MDSSGGGGGSRVDPARLLDIAGKLLAARDLVGCKRLADRAVAADPLLPGADRLLAVVDVLLGSQRVLPSGRPDPLAVLGLQQGADLAAAERSFHRLSQLLDTAHNPHNLAGSALLFVQQAFADLPDHLKSASADPPPPPAADPAPADAFWTACPYCFNVYQYQREFVGRKLRCQNTGCRRAFEATELPNEPPIVPGTDMYYCAWGFVPVGFPKAADLTTNWKPFCPMLPCDTSAPPLHSAGTANVEVQNVENNGIPINASSTPANLQPVNTSGVGGNSAGPSRGRVKKTTARKKVGTMLKKRAPGGVESGIEPSMVRSDSWNGSAGSAQTVFPREININEVAKPTDGATILNFGGDDEIAFDLDVEATDAMLGNLQHLPFLREDDNTRRMF